MKKFDVFKTPSLCPAGVVPDDRTNRPLFYSSWKDGGYGRWSNSSARWKDSNGWSNSSRSWKDNNGWSNSSRSWKDSGGWSNSTGGK